MPESQSSGAPPPSGPVSWRHLLAETTDVVGDRNHARWMCEVASGCGSTEFAAELDQPPTHRMVAHLDAMIARRIAGEPLQYVLGSWQFRWLDLMIDRRVLIPRPETEWVTEIALDLAGGLIRDGVVRDGIVRDGVALASGPVTVVDLGTGSGAIGLSLAVELPVGSANVWLVDVSADALDVARANLAGIGRAGAAVSIAQGSWFAALPNELKGSIDLVVANPPYVAVGDPDVADDVYQWEPHRALYSGVDGLDDIRIVVEQAASWLRPGGRLVIEIGSGQGPAVLALLDQTGFADRQIRPDLTGRDRVAIGRRPDV